jgi:hypothetical protein
MNCDSKCNKSERVPALQNSAPVGKPLRQDVIIRRAETTALVLYASVRMHACERTRRSQTANYPLFINSEKMS